MVQIFDNTAEVIASLQGRKEAYRQALEDGAAKAGVEIVELFRSEWLSGRQAGDLGLNIRTGRLYQSIKSLTIVDGTRVASQIYNTGAPYWAYHQDGDGVMKRLYLEEAFQEDGERIYQGVVEAALERLVA